MRAWIPLCLLASAGWADCQPSEALTYLKPGALWSMSGSTYDKLAWADSVQTKPTRSEFDKAIADCTTAQSTDAQARVDAKAVVLDKTKTAAQRLQALIDYLGIK